MSTGRSVFGPKLFGSKRISLGNRFHSPPESIFLPLATIQMGRCWRSRFWAVRFRCDYPQTYRPLFVHLKSIINEYYSSGSSAAHSSRNSAHQDKYFSSFSVQTVKGESAKCPTPLSSSRVSNRDSIHFDCSGGSVAVLSILRLSFDLRKL